VKLSLSQTYEIASTKFRYDAAGKTCRAAQNMKLEAISDKKASLAAFDAAEKDGSAKPGATASNKRPD
jgi:hypothetical protein